MGSTVLFIQLVRQNKAIAVRVISMSQGIVQMGQEIGLDIFLVRAVLMALQMTSRIHCALEPTDQFMSQATQLVKYLKASVRMEQAAFCQNLVPMGKKSGLKSYLAMEILRKL